MNKQILSLLLLIVVLAAAIYYLLAQPGTQTQGKTYLFPELSQQANQIRNIRLVLGEGELFSANPSENGWMTVVGDTTRSYPVDQNQLTALVEGLAGAILHEAKTAKPENFVKLGLSAIEAPDSQARLVEVTTNNDTYQVLIGNVASSGQGSYARFPEQNQTWLLDTTIEVSADLADWLQQPILDISAEQIDYIKRTDINAFEIQRTQALELMNMGEEQVLKYDDILDNYTDEFVSLRFDDIVLNEQAQSWFENDQVVSFEIGLNSGTVVNARLLSQESESLVKFDASNQATQPYWHGLTYRISNFAAGQLNKSFNDFVEDEQEPAVQEIPVPPVDEGESPN